MKDHIIEMQEAWKIYSGFREIDFQTRKEHVKAVRERLEKAIKGAMLLYCSPLPPRVFDNNTIISNGATDQLEIDIGDVPDVLRTIADFIEKE